MPQQPPAPQAPHNKPDAHALGPSCAQALEDEAATDLGWVRVDEARTLLADELTDPVRPDRMNPIYTAAAVAALVGFALGIGLSGDRTASCFVLACTATFALGFRAGGVR